MYEPVVFGAGAALLVLLGLVVVLNRKHPVSPRRRRQLRAVAAAGGWAYDETPLMARALGVRGDANVEVVLGAWESGRVPWTHYGVSVSLPGLDRIRLSARRPRVDEAAPVRLTEAGEAFLRRIEASGEPPPTRVSLGDADLDEAFIAIGERLGSTTTKLLTAAEPRRQLLALARACREERLGGAHLVTAGDTLRVSVDLHASEYEPGQLDRLLLLGEALRAAAASSALEQP